MRIELLQQEVLQQAPWIEMRKDIAQKLKQRIKEVVELFSRPDRSRNFNNETFKFNSTIPLSEYTAAVVFDKNTGKKALAFFYWVNSGEGYWHYFFPSDSHILGMELFGKYKQQIEVENFDKNE